MQTKTNFTTVTNDGIFTGYAVLWDQDYYDGKGIAPGAFVGSLGHSGVEGVKMLYEHDLTLVIGRWLEIVENDKGLFVRGQLNLETEKGREVKSQMERGEVDGLSLGYDVIATNGDKTIVLKLWEISVVSFPAMEEATVDEIEIHDTLTIDKSQFGKRTADGYLAVSAKVGRVGIQEYTGASVGKPELAVVRVYRPESEVFDKASLASFANRPVTNDHPPEAVDANNWKKYSVGQIDREVARDGDFVRVPFLLMDQGVIADVERGKRQLSLGYRTKLVWGAGVTPDGLTFDAIQTNIRGNHLAVVTAARGGPELRIGDGNEGDEEMTFKLTVDGIETEFATDVSRSVVTRAIKNLEETAAKLKSQLEEKEEELKKEKAAKDSAIADAKKVTDTSTAEIATLKKQLEDAAMTPAKLDELVKDRAEVVAKATAVLGDKLVVDGKSLDEIKRQVVDAEMKDAAKGWNMDAVNASFNTIVAKTTVDSAGGLNGTRRLADSLGRPIVVNDSQKLYSERDKVLTEAWKKPTAA